MDILPILDSTKLQEAANNAAMAGTIKALNEYYNGYNSPYTTALREELDKKNTSIHLELPDIVALINDKISAEVDLIANRAIAQTLLPDLKRALTRRPEIVLFSDILKSAIEDIFEVKQEDCRCEIEIHPKFGWLNVRLIIKERRYEFTLHKDNEKPLYWCASLSRDEHKHEEMELSIDNIKVKIPFTTGVLKNKLQQYLASIIISGSKIEMDVEDFEYNMFENCHCY